MKYQLLVFVLFMLVVPSASGIQLSENSKISVVTCAAGSEIYSLFGHTALRVEDKDQNFDIVFNYGLFSFSSTNFYWNFFKGHTDYILGAQKYSAFMQEYVEQERNVWFQELDLSVEQKNSMLDFLINNLKPENRTYRYNYFDNNCATKIVDLIEDVTNESVLWGEVNEPLTYRIALIKTLDVVPWVRFGVDLILGADADSTIVFKDKMFLPEVLMKGVVQAETHSKKRILKDSGLLYKGVELKRESIFALNGPFMVLLFLLICFVAITFYTRKSEKRLIVIDFILFFIYGIAGVFIFALSIMSVHPTVSDNFNLLWLNPLHVIFAFVLLKNKQPKWTEYYKLINLFLLLVFVIITLFKVQTAYVPLYFLVGIIALRLYSFKNYKLIYKK